MKSPIVLRASIIFLTLAATGCDNTPVVQTAKNGCSIHDYGQNVYYFDCASDFGHALAEFRKDHEIVTVTGYASQDGTTGYWVVTK